MTNDRENLRDFWACEFPITSVPNNWEPSEIFLAITAGALLDIGGTLARIDEKLGGIEMNTRPRL